MKSIIAILLTAIMSNALLVQSQDENRFALKGNFVMSILGGGFEIIGNNVKSMYPVINPTFGYHISDRFSLVADVMFYTNGPGDTETSKMDYAFNKAVHYGVAGKYYTKKNLKCGTPTFQTGIYLFDTDVDKPKLNWLFTPGLIYPLGKKEKFFAEMAFDFQINKIIQGEAFLMTAKLGVSLHF